MPKLYDLEQVIDGIIAATMEDLPVASVIAFKLDIPLFYMRESRKKYGMKKEIEGADEVYRRCKNLYLLKNGVLVKCQK